jgi:carbon monoxide dehydrogenase subunit G
MIGNACQTHRDIEPVLISFLFVSFILCGAKLERDRNGSSLPRIKSCVVLFSVHLDCSASAEKAHAFMVDARNFLRWDPSVVRVEHVGGAIGALASEFDVYVKTVSTTRMRFRVTANRPERIVLEAKTTFVHSHDEVLIDSRGGHSVVTYNASLRLRGPLSTGDRMLKGPFFRLCEKAVPGLRRALAGLGES